MNDDLFDHTQSDDVLAPMVAGPFVIGYVDEIHGPGAEVMSGYPLTRHELLVLARHWYQEYLNDSIFFFHYGQAGSRQMRMRVYSLGRVGKIEAVVGESAVDKVVDEVRSEERAGMGEENWRIFIEGDKSEWDRVQEQTYQVVEELDAKKADEVTCRAAFEFLAAHPTEFFIDSSGDMWHLVLPEVGRDPTSARLVMKVRLKTGGWGYTKYHIDCPPAWYPPYGIT